MLPGLRSDLPHRSEADQRAFFEDVAALARRACDARGAVERDVVLASSRIRLVFAGPALESLLLPALAHLQTKSPGVPDVVLHVWDSASTGVVMCPPPVGQECFSERGDIWTLHSKRVKSAFHWSEYSLSLLDLDRGEGVFWVRSSEGLPYWTQASPFRTLIHWWMEEQGAQLVHAAALGTPYGGVLITGRGGVGKSTTALSCLAAGFDYVGDDYVILTGEEKPRAHSLYRTAKVNLDEISRFLQFSPRTLGNRLGPGGEKAVMFLGGQNRGRLVPSVPVDAVLTPRFGEVDETCLEPVDAARLLGSTIYTTLAQLPHAGQRTVDFIERQLGKAPGFSLVLGRARERVPVAIATWLENRSASTSDRIELPGARANDRLISVVIPVFNGAHFLSDAVSSVLSQGYPKVEILVVDDGSTDAIEEAVAALPVQVRFLRQPHAGQSAARNLGIRAASAEVIAMLDVDDLWPARRLDASLGRLDDDPETDVVIGRAQLMEQAANGAFDYVGSPAEAYTCYIGSAVYRRRVFDRVGLFDPELRLAEDTDWFAKAERGGAKVEHLDMVTLLVRRHPANTTRNLTPADLVPLRLVRNALTRKRSGGVEHG